MPLRQWGGECLQHYGVTSYAPFLTAARLDKTWRDRSMVRADGQPLPSSEMMSSHSAWRFAWQL